MSSVAWPKHSLHFALFFFAYYGYIGVFTPYASLYFSEKGMTAAQIALLLSLMQILRIIGPAFWGWVADSTGQRARVLQVTAFAAALMFCGMFLGQTFTHFFLIMIGINTFTSAQAPLSDALMIANMKGDLTHYGRIRLWGSVGFIVSVTLAGYLLDWYGIGFFPWVTLLLLVAVFAVSVRLQDSAPVIASQDTPSLMALMKQPAVIAFFASTFLMLAAHASLYVFYSLYLAQIGYSKVVIGFMWSLGVVAEIVFFYYQAPIFQRFGVKTLMLASLLFAVLRFAMIGWFAQSLLGLLIAQILHAVTFGTHHSASIAMLQRWFSGGLQARGQALYNSIAYGLGGTAGGLILSVFWERFSPESVYFIAAIFALGAVACAKLSFRWQAYDEVSK